MSLLLWAEKARELKPIVRIFTKAWNAMLKRIVTLAPTVTADMLPSVRAPCLKAAK